MKCWYHQQKGESLQYIWYKGIILYQFLTSLGKWSSCTCENIIFIVIIIITYCPLSWYYVKPALAKIRFFPVIAHFIYFAPCIENIHYISFIMFTWKKKQMHVKRNIYGEKMYHEYVVDQAWQIFPVFEIECVTV